MKIPRGIIWLGLMLLGWVPIVGIYVLWAYTHPAPAASLYCCKRPVDVLGNAQELHAASDSFQGCLAKRGAPIMIPTETPDGRVIVFYVACAVGTHGT